MSVKIPPGVFDILPESSPDTWRSSYIWNYVESVIRETTKAYGYQEIRTPVFERTELFKRGVGEETDIVAKEMYTFDDRGGRSMSLRPEGTAPVMRAFVEHHLESQGQVHKLFYIGPMFRYERAQAGRYRQHHQFGVEAIGYDHPEQDVEVIDLLYTVYNRLGIQNLKIELNSIGERSCRTAFREALRDYLHEYFDELSLDSKRRFDTNPLRILDSKSPEDQKIIENAPSILDFLTSESRDHFEKVKSLLNTLKIPYEVNPKLVRGLDYYNKTVFEIVSEELGAQNSIGGGGRYDGLLKALGGPDLPTIGFGTGIERIIHTMLKQHAPSPDPYHPVLFLIPLGEAAKTACFSILHKLRQDGIPSQMDFSGRKLNKLMQYANQIRAQFVVVVGDNEIETSEVELKEMATGKTTKAPLHRLSRILQLELNADDFLRVWNEMSTPFEEPSEVEFFVKKLEKSIAQTSLLTKNLQQAMEKMQTLLD